MEEELEFTKEKLIALQNDLDRKAEQCKKYGLESRRFVDEAVSLRDKLKKNEIQTTEMVAFLRNEMVKRDEKIKTLDKTIEEKEKEIENLHKTKQNSLEKQKINLDLQMKKELESKNKIIEGKDNDLYVLRYISKHKKELESGLFAAKTTIEKQAEEFEKTIEKLERKHILDLDIIREKKKREKQEIEQMALQQATKKLKKESKRIRKENKNFQKQLDIHTQTSTRLVKENKELVGNARRLKLELSLSETGGEEILRRSTKIKRQNHKLNEKNTELEETLGRTIREVKKEHMSLVLKNETNTKQTSEENELLKSALAICHGELERVRKHAIAILKQRTECEQFLYGALEDVQEEIREHRRFQSQHGNIWKSGSRQSKSKSLALRDNITLEDLSPQQKEKVLKELLVKLNSQDERRALDIEDKILELTSHHEQPIGDNTFMTTEHSEFLNDIMNK